MKTVCSSAVLSFAALFLIILWLSVAEAGGSTLQVRRISPSGEGVEPGQQVVVQFDRRMVALGAMARDSENLPVTISPDPGCEWRWLNTSELSCRLPGQKYFAPATKYSVTVGTELAALDGSHLDQPVTEHFETWRPKVEQARFIRWRSPTQPEFRVRTNVPVTAQSLRDNLRFFVDGASEAAGQAVSIAPYEEGREGPIWLPVPGHPGVVLQVDDPQPNAPLDADKPAGDARRVWDVTPARDLNGGETYELVLSQGLKTPLGPL